MIRPERPLAVPHEMPRGETVHHPIDASAPMADARRDDRVLHRARVVLAELFGRVETRTFAIRYWNGITDGPLGGGPDSFTIVFRDPGAIRRAFFRSTELGMGEAVVRGEGDIEGNLERAVELGDRTRERMASLRARARVATGLLALPAGPPAAAIAKRLDPVARMARRHSRRRDAAAIRSHYDVGNAFYELWLDTQMVYSCAYFRSGQEDLQTAQRAKLDLLCRKLRLRPGERLLDIGCGWGGLIRHAAQHYGVYALGVTFSPAQATLANERIYDDGLVKRCAAEVLDYRDLDPTQQYDKIVSVGMFEHVGPHELSRYFRHVYALLKPRGVFLNHGIVQAAPEGRAPRGRGGFIERYVFPDGDLVTLGAAVSCAERAGFEVRDVESLREHYARTVRQWLERLEHHEDEAVRLVGNQTVRVWRLFLAASAHAFATRRIGLEQILLAKPDVGGAVDIPLTREDWYQEPKA